MCDMDFFEIVRGAAALLWLTLPPVENEEKEN